MIRYDPYTDSFIDNPTTETTATINLDAFPKNIIQMNVVEVSDASIEKIADAVVRKLADRKTEPIIYGNEHNCMMTVFGECSYAETGCGDCAVVEKVRNALDKYEPKDESQTERSE